MFDNYYRCKILCDRCPAIQEKASGRPNPMSYKNMSPTAPFAAQSLDHDGYINTARIISPWAIVPGFQFESVSFDWMHLAYLGFCRDLIPSVLKTLKLLGYGYAANETEEDFLKRTSLEMRTTCKEYGSLAALGSYTWVVSFLLSLIGKGYQTLSPAQVVPSPPSSDSGQLLQQQR